MCAINLQEKDSFSRNEKTLPNPKCPLFRVSTVIVGVGTVMYITLHDVQFLS